MTLRIRPDERLDPENCDARITLKGIINAGDFCRHHLPTGRCGLKAFLSGGSGRKEDLLELLSGDSSRCERLALENFLSGDAACTGVLCLLRYSSVESRLDLEQ